MLHVLVWRECGNKLTRQSLDIVLIILPAFIAYPATWSFQLDKVVKSSSEAPINSTRRCHKNMACRQIWTPAEYKNLQSTVWDRCRLYIHFLRCSIRHRHHVRRGQLSSYSHRASPASNSISISVMEKIPILPWLPWLHTSICFIRHQSCAKPRRTGCCLFPKHETRESIVWQLSYVCQHSRIKRSYSDDKTFTALSVWWAR